MKRGAAGARARQKNGATARDWRDKKTHPARSERGHVHVHDLVDPQTTGLIGLASRRTFANGQTVWNNFASAKLRPARADEASRRTTAPRLPPLRSTAPDPSISPSAPDARQDSSTMQAITASRTALPAPKVASRGLTARRSTRALAPRCAVPPSPPRCPRGGALLRDLSEARARAAPTSTARGARSRPRDLATTTRARRGTMIRVARAPPPPGILSASAPHAASGRRPPRGPAGPTARGIFFI